MQILKHKNFNIKTLICIHKIQYRDSKRVKMKISLLGLSLRPFNCCVKPNFFENYVDYRQEVVLGLENEELLKLDEEKELWTVS